MDWVITPVALAVTYVVFFVVIGVGIQIIAWVVR